MNSITNITDKILRDAQAIAEENDRENKAQVDAVRADFEDQAKQVADAITARAQEQADVILGRIETQDEMIRRSAMLICRREMIQKAFHTALEQLCTMSEEKQVELLAKLVAKYQKADASILLNAQDHAQFGQRLLDEAARLQKDKGFSLTLDGETGNFRGGMLLREGKIETNCTYEVLLASVQDEVEQDVAKLLFA